MPKRRTLLILAGASLPQLAGWLDRPAVGQTADGRASAFVKGIGDRLVAVVNSPDSDRDKRAKLTAIIDGAVDVDGVARFCLGRFWRNASAEQQQRFTQLFHQVLVNNITSKLGDYQGVVVHGELRVTELGARLVAVPEALVIAAPLRDRLVALTLVDHGVVGVFP